MNVKQLAEEYVVTAQPEDTVQEIAELLSQQNVGCVIIEENEQPVGIITDRDIVVSVVENGKDAGVVIAKQIMTDDPVTVNRGTDLFDVVRTMSEHGVRRLPVTENGQVVNILTLDDVFRLLTEELSELNQVLEEESSRKNIRSFV